MPVPRVPFVESSLANGLRLVLAEDHLAPVVGVNIWYNVGSKNEVPGKTGFAHLFEHVMFQGSRNVAKAEHIALVQAAGGTMNGTTWLDRTNYFETLPQPPAGAGALARGRPDGHAARRAEPGEPGQPARSRQEREALVVRQPAVRLLEREAPGAPLPAEPPVPPPHDRVDGGPGRGVRGRRQGLLPDLVRAQQRRPGDRRRLRAGRGGRLGGALLRRHPGQSLDPEARRPVAATDARRRGSRDRPRSGSAAARLLRVPRAALRRHPPRRPRSGGPDPRRRQGQPAPPAPGSRRADRPGRAIAFTLGFVGGASIAAGWATVRPGIAVEQVEAAYEEELERLAREVADGR